MLVLALCLVFDSVCIAGVGGSLSRCEQVAPATESVSTSTSRTLPALITESEHIGDDWLVDDVRGSKRKRPDMEDLFKDVNIRAEKKRNRQQPVGGGQMSEPPPRGRELRLQTLAADREDNSAMGDIFDSESALPESTVMLSDEMPADFIELRASGTAMQHKKQTRLSSSGGIVPAVARQSSVVKRKAESSGQNVTSTTVVKPPATPKPNPLRMRLKVRVGDQLILVPILERFVASRCIFMAALRSRCGHYIFALLFLSIFFFYSSPNLSGCRLDVYHTSTHGVALFRI